MYFRHEKFISVVCIFVIAFQIAQCAPHPENGKEGRPIKKAHTVKKVHKAKSTKVNNNAVIAGYPKAPDGYHYETMDSVKKKYKAGSYTIVTVNDVVKSQAASKKHKAIKAKHHDVSHDRDNNTNDHDKDGHDDDDDKHGDDNGARDKDAGDDVNDKLDDGARVKEDHGHDGHKNDDDKDDDGDGADGEEDHGHDGHKDDDGKDDDGDGAHDKEDHGHDGHKDDDGKDDDDDGAHDKEGHGHDDDKVENDNYDNGDDEHGHDDHKKDHDHKDHKDDHGHDDHKDHKDDHKDDPEDENDNYDNGDDDNGHEPDPADVLDGGVIENMEEGAKEGAGHGDKRRRKKRGFSFKLPFMSSGEETDTDTVVTAKAVSTSTTTTTTDADANATTDPTAAATTVTDTTVTATAVAAAGSGSDSAGGTSGGDMTVTAVSTVTTSNSTGFMDGIQSGVLRIYAIGKDVKTSLVVAAPYLPMVWKVAIFIVPGLSQYELLQLTMNVATVTAQAIQDYNTGHDMSSILGDVVKKAVMNSLLGKRDEGFSFGNYASNTYESLKTRFGLIPKYFSGDDTVSSVTVALDKTTNDAVEKVETEVTTINSEIPGTEITVTENVEETNKMTEDLKKKIMNMKNRAHHSSEVSVSGSDEDDDEDDDSEEKSDEVDKTLFDQVLMGSMKLQPEFIQKMSGEELVEYLNNMNLPSIVDSRPVFDSLTSKMDFNERVSDEQKSKLVDILSKVTDYFIAKSLEAKQYLNSIKD